MKLIGVIEKKKVAEGSKSERDALVVHQKGVDYILRRFGCTSSVEMDEELLELVGETVNFEGTVHGNLFIFKEMDI